MENKKRDLVIYGAGKRVFDLNDKYGLSWDARGEWEGYYFWSFTDNSKGNYAGVEMDFSRGGTVTVNGDEVEYKIYKPQRGHWRPWKVAVNMRRIHMRDGCTYTISLSGFYTADGEKFPDGETVIECLPRFVRPDGYKYDENDRAALDIAREGVVLMKNEGDVLPLNTKKINLFGDINYRFLNMVGGAGCINARFTVGIEEGLEKGGFTVNEELSNFYIDDCGFVPDAALLERAKAFSDVAIIGITRTSCEATDNDPEKGGFYLLDKEEQMISAVASVFEKTVVILNVGYPIDVRFIEKYNIKSAVWFSYLGQAAGQVLGEVLNGTVNPSGRLTDTWALDYYDHPSSANLPQNKELLASERLEPCLEIYYQEGMYVGYRYFDTYGVPVAYPFGHGLSYTDFEYKYLDSRYDGRTLTVRAEVKNVGNRAGKYVLQLYVSKPDGRLEKCAHELVDFQKTRELLPSESEILTFTVENKELSCFDTKSASMVMEAGIYKFFLGENINALTHIHEFLLENELLVEKLHNYCVAAEKYDVMSKRNGIGAKPLSSIDFESEVPKLPQASRRVFDAPVLPEYNGDIIYYDEVEKNPDLLDNFIAQMSVEELARLCVCAQAWAIDANGVAGSVYVLDKYRIKHFYAADGNSCLRMHLRTTGFPCSNAVCASFNRDLVYLVGSTIGRESYEQGVHMSLAPGMNMHRNPICGRNAEYFSEDPVLTGKMAAYHAKGLQDNKVSAVYKHVIANNNEISRFRTHAIVDERTLREIYVKSFEIAMRICPSDGIMTSYNAANDVYTATDRELILGIFREEMGFNGFVMTDWNSYFTADPVLAIANGNNWLTPGSPDDKYTKPIVDGVKDGKVDFHRLRDNVKHLVSVMLKYTRQY